MSSQITHAQLSNIHPLVEMLGTCDFKSVVAPFYQFTPSASCNGIPPLSRQSATRAQEGGPKHRETNQKLLGEPRVIYCSYASGLSTHSYPISTPSTVIPVLHKATFTPSIQPNLGLTPHSRLE